RTRNVTLQAKIAPRFPLDIVEKVEWRFQSSKTWNEMPSSAPGQWTIDLSKLPWGRGSYLVEVRVRTAYISHTETTADSFTYVPEAPSLEKWKTANFPKWPVEGMIVDSRELKYPLAPKFESKVDGEVPAVSVYRIGPDQKREKLTGID